MAPGATKENTCKSINKQKWLGPMPSQGGCCVAPSTGPLGRGHGPRHTALNGLGGGTSTTCSWPTANGYPHATCQAAGKTRGYPLCFKFFIGVFGQAINCVVGWWRHGQTILHKQPTNAQTKGYSRDRGGPPPCGLVTFAFQNYP